MVLLVRSYLLFAACSCLGFLGVVVVDVVFVVVIVSLFLLLPAHLGMLWAVVVVVVVVGGGNKDWEPVEIISFYKVFSV